MNTRYLLLMTCLAPLAQADDNSPAYSQCMDKASSTVAMSSCIQAETQLQDQRLNRVYKQLATKLDAGQLQALLSRVEAGPMPAVDGVVRWRLVDLAQWVFEEFRVSLSVQTLSRLLRAAGYRKLTARPRHQGQDPEAIATFKKTSPPRWPKSGTRSSPARP